MKKTTTSTIGFDRYIELAWVDYALDLALIDGEPSQLRNMLNKRINGKESSRKTYNLLNNLWIRPSPEIDVIRARALDLARKLPQNPRIVLHWGMALANFKLFAQTTTNMGILLRIQGYFHKHEIQQRISEVYSNQGTIPRAVSRIIQSIYDWNIIKVIGNSKYICGEKIIITNTDLFIWLLQATLTNHREQPVSFTDIFRLPELFPFEYAGNGQKLIREASEFNIIREGLNQEYVILT